MPLKEKESCHWPWGGIVVRELFLAGGGKSSTATGGYGSCNRPGVLLRPGPTGRFDQGYKTMNEFRGEKLKGIAT